MQSGETDPVRAAPSSLERCSFGSESEFFARYLRQERPAVFRDYVSAWPAMQRWSLAWFKERHGHTPLPIYTGRNLPVASDSRRAFTEDSLTLTLADFIDSLQDPAPREPRYLSALSLERHLPDLARDVAFPKVTSRLPGLSQLSLWISRPGTITQLHYDRSHNLFAQIVGRKRFHLYAPARRKELAPAQVDGNWAAVVSQLELPAPVAVARLPVADIELELEPGELLFLPYGWWHRVESVGACVSVNLWWWTAGTLLAHAAEVAGVAARQAWQARRPQPRRASTKSEPSPAEES